MPKPGAPAGAVGGPFTRDGGAESTTKALVVAVAVPVVHLVDSWSSEAGTEHVVNWAENA